MRAIRWAALCLGAASDGSRRLRAPDEDPFTMAATALERLVAVSGVGSTQGATLRLTGAVAQLPPELFRAVAGWPEPLAGDDGTGSRIEVVLGASVDDARAPGGEPTSEGGVAVLMEDGGAGAPSLFPIEILEGDGPTITGLLRAHANTDRHAVGWVGDWGADLARGRPPPASPPSSGPPPVHVSEGSYLSPASYRDGMPSRFRFVAQRCSACSTVTFPARGRCRSCLRHDGLTAVPMPHDHLAVEAVTWIGPGGQPTEFDDQVAATGTYGVALVALGGGVRATVALTDVDVGAVPIGARVDTRLRRLYAIDGSWRYGRKAVPSPPP